MLELIYHYIVFEQPEYGYGLGQDYKYVKYPRTSLMRSIINDKLMYTFIFLSTKIPNFQTGSEPNNIDDVKLFLIEAMNLYESTAQEVF